MSGILYPGCFRQISALVLFVAIMSVQLIRESYAGASSSSELTLHQVLSVVEKNDFRLKQLNERSLAFLSESKAASYLPDPTVFAAIQNLPTDTFELDQEPMTQLRVGLRQMFPKGDTLDIQSDMSGIKSDMQLIAKQHYWLEARKHTEQAWLEAWYWQKNLALLDEDQVFLEQVQGFVRSLYEVGARDQSDLIGANLELIKLNEKRIEAKQRYQSFRLQLETLANEALLQKRVSDALPSLKADEFSQYDQTMLERLISKHPKIVLLDQESLLAEKKVDLITQDFEPAWGIEASYGLRDGENMDGSDRPDFFSAGVSVQLPLFSRAKQTQRQDAAKIRSRAAQLKRDEAFSQMRFEAQNLIQQYRYSVEQRMLYETEILPTLENQTASALQSYESDQGDFRFVMNLFLKEQSAQSMHQRLRVNEQKLISSLNYVLGIDATAANMGAL